MAAQEIARDEPPATTLSLKTGGICLLIGALGFATVRLLHGDTPAADADAALTFVAGRPTYAAVHIVAVLAATTIAIGIMALAGSLTRPSAWILGRAGTTTAVIGTAIFGVESTSEGLALPELASAAQADPGQRADIVNVTRAVAAATHGPSLVAIALFIGATLLLIGLSIRLEGYPAWLGIVGAIIGTVALTAAVGPLPAAVAVPRSPALRRPRLYRRAALACDPRRCHAAPGDQRFRIAYQSDVQPALSQPGSS